MLSRNFVRPLTPAALLAALVPTIGSAALGQTEIGNGSLTITGMSASTGTLTLGQPGKPGILNNAGILSVSASSGFGLNSAPSG